MDDTVAPAADRVDAGVAALDAKDPGWWRTNIKNAIDLDRLDMTSCKTCVLGQRFGYFGDGPIPTSQAEALGFEAIDPNGRLGELRADYEALQAEWIRVIEERRATAQGVTGDDA